MLASNHKDTKAHPPTRVFEPIPMEEEAVARNIVDAAYTVRKNLGPGLLEKAYEVCFCHELKKRGLEFESQTYVPIHYDGIDFKEGLRLDFLVEDSIICELKSANGTNEIWKAQILSNLKLLDKRLGFIINFNVPTIKQGIKRIIL